MACGFCSPLGLQSNLVLWEMVAENPSSSRASALAAAARERWSWQIAKWRLNSASTGCATDLQIQGWSRRGGDQRWQLLQHWWDKIADQLRGADDPLLAGSVRSVLLQGSETGRVRQETATRIRSSFIGTLLGSGR
jgi:hypothetical protein